ncbi:MAG TPA: hypothetical protein VD764_09895 [Nocardioides sp.]|nr:hypothetical protein [Nocardioides sp.]
MTKAGADMDAADPSPTDTSKRGDHAFDQMTTGLGPAVRTIVMWERQFPR